EGVGEAEAAVRVGEQPAPARVQQGGAGVVAGQLPRLRHEWGRAHEAAAVSSIGTQTRSAPGSTRTFSFATGARSPPSSSYTVLASKRTSMRVPVVVGTRGGRRARPVTRRPKTRIHRATPAAVT